jgi:hypothetical protein
MSKHRCDYGAAPIPNFVITRRTIAAALRDGEGNNKRNSGAKSTEPGVCHRSGILIVDTKEYESSLRVDAHRSARIARVLNCGTGWPLPDYRLFESYYRSRRDLGLLIRARQKFLRFRSQSTACFCSPSVASVLTVLRTSEKWILTSTVAPTAFHACDACPCVLSLRVNQNIRDRTEHLSRNPVRIYSITNL